MNANDFGRQLHTYWMIVAYIRAKGFPPTIAELAEMRGLAINAINTHLRQLESRGYIYREKGWRNIRLSRKDAA